MMGRKQRNRDNLKKLAIGGTIAAAAGYITGVMTAPKSGKETRQDLKKAADKRRAEAEKELKKLHTDLDQAIKDTKKSGTKLSAKTQKELDSLLERAKDTKEKAREILSAVHEGDADDRDLSKAISDANKALDHIKDFIKK